MSVDKMSIAVALAQFQAELASRMGEAVDLSLVQEFVKMYFDIVVAMNDEE